MEIVFSKLYSFSPLGSNEFILNQPEFNKPGMYLWLIKFNNEYLVNYVGISYKKVIDRLESHITNYLSGQYTIWDPINLRKGVRNEVYDAYLPNAIEVFLTKYKEISLRLDALLKSFEISICLFSKEKNRTMDRVESALAYYLKENQKPNILDNLKFTQIRKDEKEIDIKVVLPFSISGAGRTFNLKA